MYNRYGSSRIDPNRIYRVGIYCRLSDADIRKGREESESIVNQLAICRDFIARHSNLVEVKVYIDDGFTGLNYDRAGFQKMMRDIDAGIIDTIITKTLSRLGREQAETMRLFKQDFVEKGVRYISVNDNIDFYGMIEDFEIPFKVLMNDYYSMEISKNVRSANLEKQKKGEFIGSFAPYGYKKDPDNHNHLIPDEKTADVVRMIFKSYINGTGIVETCLKLNDMHILPPAEYKQSIGMNYTQGNDKILPIWKYETVRHMLSNEVYIGAVVQNRDNKVAYNLKKKVRLPKSQWIVVKNMHEPIVSEEDFNFAQKILKEHWYSRDPAEDDVTKYMGILKCGDCGHSMSKAKRSRGLVFRCGTYARFGVKLCTSHWINEQDLDAIVLKEINKVIKEAIDKEKVLKQKKVNIKKIEQMVCGERKRYEASLKSLEDRNRRMVLNLSNGIISEDDFKIFKDDYNNEKKSLKDKIRDLQNKSDSDIIYLEEFEDWIDSFIQYKGITEITREVLVNLISEIQFFETEDELKIVIHFRFKNPFENIS